MKHLVIVLSFACASESAWAASDGFRCPRTGRLVSVGQKQAEVLARCRQPDMQLQHMETRRSQTYVTQTARVLTPQVIPAAILQYLQWRSQLQPSPPSPVLPGAVPVGPPRVVVTPAVAPAVVVRAVPTTVTTVQEQETQIVVDDWVYDFGDSRFIRSLRFENGVLVAVEEGSYGAPGE